MKAKAKKKSGGDDREEFIDRVLGKAEKTIRGLKMPGFGDWVKVTVIGRLSLAPLRPMYGFDPPEDSRALPREAVPEPEWEMCAPFRTTFRAGDVSEFSEDEKGVMIIRHSMGPNARILVKESWDEVSEIMGAEQVIKVEPDPDHPTPPWEE